MQEEPGWVWAHGARWGVVLEHVTVSSGTGRHAILFKGMSMEQDRLLELDTVLR